MRVLLKLWPFGTRLTLCVQCIHAILYQFLIFKRYYWFYTHNGCSFSYIFSRSILIGSFSHFDRKKTSNYITIYCICCINFTGACCHFNSLLNEWIGKHHELSVCAVRAHSYKMICILFYFISFTFLSQKKGEEHMHTPYIKYKTKRLMNLYVHN